MRLVTGPQRAFAHLNAIDATHRRNFSRGTGHEHFISQVQGFAGQYLLAHFDTQIFCQLDDGVAGDARQRGRSEWRRKQNAVFHFKQVFTRAFGDVAIHIQRDTFLITVAARFAADQQ